MTFLASAIHMPRLLVALVLALLQLSSAFVLTGGAGAAGLRRRSVAPAMKVSFKTGDTVQIITGDSKGETGKIISVDRTKGKVMVEGINMQTKHVRRLLSNHLRPRQLLSHPRRAFVLQMKPMKGAPCSCASLTRMQPPRVRSCRVRGAL